MQPHQGTRSCWLAAGRRHMGGLLLTAVLLGLAGCGQRTAGAPMAVPDQATSSVAAQEAEPTTPGAPSAASPTPTTDIYLLYGNEGMVYALREELARTDLPPETRQRVEERLAYQEERAAAFATVKAQPTRPRAAQQDFAPAGPPVPSPTAGIFDGSTPSNLYGTYDIDNAWREAEDGGAVVVFAGVEENDPAQGGVYVQVGFPNQRPTGWHRTPTRSGSVRIIAEQNWQLTLEAENGDLFVFDVNARRFVDDPPASTPTGDPDATPTATGTPEAAE